jgi:peptide-methionine (S)-S-oxide reductase
MKRLAFFAFAALLGLSTSAQAATRTAVFAGGCFWSVEKFFEAAPGVVRAVSGYSGGAMSNPIYGDHEGHLEAVQVTYDPAKTSYSKLVDHFFRNIDPTDPNGQICDLGPSYRTAIFVASAEERQMAEAAKARVAGVLKKTVATQVRPGMRFWTAEAYHQDFAKKNPARYEAYRIGCGRDRRLKAVWGGR